MSKRLKIAQFDLLSTKQSIEYTIHNNLNYSKLVGVFKLKRHISYFITTSYIPCLLVVFMSWVGFYIDGDYCQDRISISVTSLLTILLKLNIENTSDMPKVSYLKAIDYYMFSCFGFIIFSIIEFAFLNKKKKQKQREEEQKSKTIKQPKKSSKSNHCTLSQSSKKQQKLRHKYLNVLKRSSSCEKKRSLHRLTRHNSYIGKRLSSARNTSHLFHFSSLSRSSLSLNESVSSPKNIKSYARIIYPVAFILFNIIYFVYYIYY